MDTAASWGDDELAGMAQIERLYRLRDEHIDIGDIHVNGATSLCVGEHR